ncbi:Unknown protein [Striga hermonthica]|uniref:HAT C-terminal dimerisation domain-containing protein n=1 Tax=Striga hermonthica TaxID=68872 RepID=A0A9N7NYZ6_STRHE|nr:Unknown protein [Striga hermonthica]
MAYTLNEMYGVEKGEKILEEVKHELFELFKEYKKKYDRENDANASIGIQTTSTSSASIESISTKPESILKAKFKRQKLASGGYANKKSELEVYLNEDVLEGEEDLDVLKWWKSNSERFWVLSRMVRDTLGVPISTVASESAFSTGGRGYFRVVLKVYSCCFWDRSSGLFGCFSGLF